MAEKKNEYRLPRDQIESTRLNMQHEIHRRNFGYSIHPSINLNQPHLKVADLGCGTGVFLRTLKSALPANVKAELYGFDISAKQFPPQSELPEGIELNTHDLTDPFPQALQNTFDLVHCRLVGSGFRPDQWESSLGHACSLLKPGGHIQWTEPDHLVEAKVVALTEQGRISQRTSTLERLYQFSVRRQRDLDWDRETHFACKLSSLMRKELGAGFVREDVVPIDWCQDKDMDIMRGKNAMGFWRAALEDFVELGMSDDEVELRTQEDIDKIMSLLETDLFSGDYSYRYYYHAVVGRKALQ